MPYMKSKIFLKLLLVINNTIYSRSSGQQRNLQGSQFVAICNLCCLLCDYNFFFISSDLYNQCKYAISFNIL